MSTYDPRLLAAAVDTEIARVLHEEAKVRIPAGKGSKAAQRAVQKLTEQYAALEAVYRAYYWTRFYIVPGGHVHRSTSCSSLHWNTLIFQLDEYSGMSEEELVNMAGEKACTICYPSAPVEKKSMLPVHVAEREAVAKDAAERAQKAALATTAAITDPVGTRVIFKSRRAAENDISAALGWAVWTLTVEAVDEDHRKQLEGLVREHLNAARATLALLALNGITDVDVEKKLKAQARKYGFTGVLPTV